MPGNSGLLWTGGGGGGNRLVGERKRTPENAHHGVGDRNGWGRVTSVELNTWGERDEVGSSHVEGKERTEGHVGCLYR